MSKKLLKEAIRLAVNEALDDRRVYDLLTNAFGMTVTPEDVRFIRFRPMRNAVQMIDVDGALGNMSAGVGQRELSSVGITPQELGAWLASHGAQPIKAKRPVPSGPMGGYD